VQFRHPLPGDLDAHRAGCEQGLGQRETPAGAPYGRRRLQRGFALQALANQLLPLRCYLGLAGGDTPLKVVEALPLAGFLGGDGFDSLLAHTDQFRPFSAQLSAPDLGTSGMVERSLLLDQPNAGCLQHQPALALDARLGFDPAGRIRQPVAFGVHPLPLGIEPGLFPAYGDQSGLQQVGDLSGLPPLGADVLLAQQVGEQGLDLAGLVGAQLALALGRERGSEKGLRAAQQVLDTLRIGPGLAVGDRAIGKLQRPPLPGLVPGEQVGFGSTPAIAADDYLRAVA